MMTDYRPTLSLANAQKKAAFLRKIREFFYQRDVMEVTTPILSNRGNTDVFIESVSVNFHQQGQPKIGYLHTSPEFAMKRLLATYQVPMYQLCQVFRDNEKGHKHNIEFTMLEWYRPRFDLDMLADELQALLTTVFGTPMDMIKLSYADAFIKTIQIHPLSASIEMLRACALSHGITLDMGDDHQGWLDLLFSHLVEPTLGFGTPTLITDYPPATASLAKMSVDADGHQVAKRFELYINGIEIANAYDELADGKALRQRFEQDNAQRIALGLPVMPIDEHLLAACDDLPECSGIALGVDRLFMVVAGLTDISQSIAIMTEQA